MEYGVAVPVRGGPVERPADAEVAGRMRELEEDNARLRLLVSELLVENQRLREGARKAVAPAA